MVGIGAFVLSFIFWFIVCKYLLKPMRVKIIMREKAGENSFKFHVADFFSQFIWTVPMAIGIFGSGLIYPFVRDMDGPEGVYILTGFAFSSFLSGIIIALFDMYVWDKDKK